MGSHSYQGDRDLEQGPAPLPLQPSSQVPSSFLSSSPLPSPSPAPSPSSASAASAPALVLSNSGKRIDQKKKYVKQVTGRHNDTDLHLAAKRGDLAAVKLILGEIDAQMVGAAASTDFDAEVAEIRSAVVNEVNELGETALFGAAECGHLEVVEELLKYSDRDGVARKNQSGFDALHKAATQGQKADRLIDECSLSVVERDAAGLLLEHEFHLIGRGNEHLASGHALNSFNNCLPVSTCWHIEGDTIKLLQLHFLLSVVSLEQLWWTFILQLYNEATDNFHTAIVQVLLDHYPELSKTLGPSNATPLVSAASRGHTEVVHVLLAKDSSLLEIAKNNGKNALHLAARQGHAEIVKALLDKDSQLARRTDKKGQTALHMAVKGVNCDAVKLLLEADAAIVMLPDKFGNTALHVATRKKRAEIVNVLLLLPDTNVNALNRDHKTAFDIAEGLPLSEEATEIKERLADCGAVRANELNQPRDELRKTVTEIKKDVHTQLEQTRRTNKNVSGIAKELRKLHREGINNATNSVTVVAVLFATVAFAAIFTVPGGDDQSGQAVVVSRLSFKIFFLFNAVALFTSLAVVVVQITLVRGETKSERRVVVVINKLMWLASVCTSVAFIASSYIVVGRHHKWAAILVTLIGGVIMAGVLSTMTYYVVKSKRSRSLRKRDKASRRSGSNSWHHSEFSDSEINPIYAL
ncbi:Ankyrin repeat-containing protein itn1 [Asimina triloba]